jgi:uncharacterized membrane protein
MNYLVHIPLYLYLGLGIVWHYALDIPHPTWHKLIEALMTGFIIKAGYWIAHKVLPHPKRQKKLKAGAGLGTASGVAEYLNR